MHRVATVGRDIEADEHTGCHGLHCHSHGMGSGRLDRAMMIGVGLNLAFVVVELFFGFLSGSLALIADAGHNASDVLGLVLAWGADFLARRPPTRKYTWGLRRSTIYAAFFNALLLVVACGGILWEAWHRLGAPHVVAGPTMIGVAAIGVVINTLTALLFFHGHHDANIRGAFLHMAADAAISLGVVAAGIAILLTGLAWIDPVVSIAITLVIVAGTWGLFIESIDLALDAVPRGIDINAVEQALAGLPGVVGVHELHVWGASTSETSLTAHLDIHGTADHDAVLHAAHTMLRERFHIAHTTIQAQRSRRSAEASPAITP
ncbi:MAG: cation diffusion facilitator family transporter [Planctomycetia bacterium]